MFERQWFPSSTVAKYYLYTATTAAGFYSPVLYLLFRSAGLSFTQISLVEGLFMVVAVLGEIPTGYVADRLGWRKSLLASILLVSATVFAMGFADSFLAFAVLHVTWSLGRAFKSGSDEAWLYEVLKDRFDEDEFARINGRARAVRSVVGAGGALVGGYLGDVALAYPFFLAGAVNALGFAVVLTFPKTVEGSTDDEFTTFDALPVIREKLSEPPLASFVVYFVLVAYLVGGITPFIQPVSKDLGVSTTHLGWLYAGFSVVSAVMSYYTGEIRDAIGIQGWFLAMPVVAGVGLMAARLVPAIPVVLPVFFFVRAVRNVTHPLATQYLNDHLDSVGRATVLSAVSMVGAVAGIGIEVGAGMVADATSPLTALGVTGACLVAVAVGGHLLTTPVETATDRRKRASG